MRGVRVRREAEDGNYRIEWIADDGSARSVATDTAIYADAVELAARLSASPAAHAAAYPIDLETCLAAFLDTASLDKSLATRRCYAQKAGHLARLLGAIVLPALHMRDVEHFLSLRLQEGAARETCRKELVVLRQALRFAKRRGWLPEVSLDRYFPSFAAPYRPRDRYLTAEQAAALLAELAPGRRLWVCVAAWAGLRLSEVEGLRWTDVDFDTAVLRVRGNKTDGSFRIVGLAPDLLALLRDRRAVAGPIVQPWPNVRRDLAVACARAGVPRVTPNDLRRTFASWLVQAGESNFVVSKLLGHSTTKMVDLVYGQLNTATLRSSVAKLPELPVSGHHPGPTINPRRLRKR